MGEELNNPKSRFWRVYLDETNILDRNLLRQNGDALDGLLVFVRLQTTHANNTLTYYLGWSLLSRVDDDPCAGLSGSGEKLRTGQRVSHGRDASITAGRR